MVVPGVIKDLAWMTEMLNTLECPGHMPLTARCGFFTYIKIKGSHGFSWIDVRVVSSELSHPLQFVQQY